MELSFETDAEALWQDALDLLGDKNLPPAVLAMLQQCKPAGLEDSTLVLTTSMRLVVKKVAEIQPLVEECLSTAAFEPTRLKIEFTSAKDAGHAAPSAPAPSRMSAEEARRWDAATAAPAAPPAGPTPRRIAEDDWDERSALAEGKAEIRRRRAKNPLVDDIPDATSKLTFERFVRGDENDIACQAALQVANGVNSAYNPLFIYGKSGLGKTHLLRAIQNYIVANDPTRLVVYRESSNFISDYTNAMRDQTRSAAQALRQNYSDIDVLIIDDVQKLAGKTGTVNFFFDTFNELANNGKQIVLAADRTPAQLGMGKDGLDERVTSRMASGFSASIDVPSYELKVRLIDTFCERMREDARRENVATLTGTVPAEAREHMVERAGTNIRLIEGFCQRCLIAETAAEARGATITRDEIDAAARVCWPNNRKNVTIEDVQKCVEKYYDVDHVSLVGNKRHKAIMEARHVAIWLCRDLCDSSLVEIGKHFGGRTHATVNHSISVVDDARREDKIFYERLMQIKESIVGNV